MYARIFTSLFNGSMRGHSDLILVFVNMLCHADKGGFVDLHWRVIVDETGMPADRVKAAIAELEGPDPDSRSKTADGCRIQRIDPGREWGWRVVNFSYYNQIRKAADRQEYMRDLMREKRKAGKNPNEKAVVSTPLAPVINVSLLDVDVPVALSSAVSKNNTDTAPSVPLKGSDTLSKGIPSSTSKSKSRGKCYARVSVNTPLMIRIGSWFNRAPTTLWMQEEANALAAIGEPVPEIALVEEFYKAKHLADKDFRRRNIITMLNNWNGEIDKAHRWEAEKDQPRGNQYGGKQTAEQRRAEQASKEYEEHIVVPTL